MNKQYIKLAVALAVFIACFILTAGFTYASCDMRCPADRGSVIICDGDTKFETVRKCGEPDYKEDLGFVFTGKFGSIINSGGSEGAYQEFAESVEKWYYDCGEGRFIKVITFRGNEVVSIVNDDRGSGPKKCW